MNSNAEALLIAQYIDGFCRAFKKEEEALRSIRTATRKQEISEANYQDGLDMGAFAASNVIRLEQDVQQSLQALQEILGSLLPTETLRVCQEKLFWMRPEDNFNQTLERDLQTLALRSYSFQKLRREMLAKDPEEISQDLPQHVRDNIANIVETEIQNLGLTE